MEEGTIHVDSIERIRLADITSELARQSGFKSVADLLKTAKHGSGRNVPDPVPLHTAGRLALRAALSVNGQKDVQVAAR